MEEEVKKDQSGSTQNEGAQSPQSQQSVESSPFMDGTSWDQISQQKFEARPEPPGDFKFADGKTFEQTDYRDSQAGQNPDDEKKEPAQGGVPEKEMADEKKQTEPAMDGTSESESSPAEEYSGLLKKYGDDPKAWASAFAGLQRLINQRNAEVDAYRKALAMQLQNAPFQQSARAELKQEVVPDASPEASPESANAPTFQLDDNTVQDIINELSDDPASGVKKLLNTAHQIAMQGASSYLQSLHAKQEEAKRQEEMRNLEQHNINLLFSRVRELKLEEARRAGDKAAEAKYGNPNYQIDQSEYLDVYPQIKQEFDFIMENMPPRDGKLTEAHFKRARLLLDPPNIQSIIRETEQRVRAQVLKEIQEGQKNGQQRVVIQPAAPVKSSAEIDLNRLHGDKDSLQENVFSKMTDEQLAKLLESAQLGYRGSLAQ